MAKVSPLIRSFNAGEFSALMQGRPDLDRYPASLKSMHNFIAAPQGPAIARSGTKFVVPTIDDGNDAATSAIIPFIFSESQAKLLELGTDRIRFIDEDGLQVYAPVNVPFIRNGSGYLVFSSTFGAELNDEVVLNGFPASYNLNGEVVRIVQKLGNIYTVNKLAPAGWADQNATVARVYHVPFNFNNEERKYMRGVQSVDVMYLLSGYRMRKLSRYGDYDWRIETFMPKDGPYMPINETPTTVRPSGTGNAIPNMTSNALPAGSTASGSTTRAALNGTPTAPVNAFGRNITYALPATQYWHAFDSDIETNWAANVAQKGIIQYDTTTPFVCDGYVIYCAKENQDPSYLAKDYSPSTFTFEAYDGTNWIVLDEQQDYVLYDGGKSVFFPLKNTVGYGAYRLNITKLVRNGPIEPRVGRLMLRSDVSAVFNLTASSTVGINYDAGFLASDVGRLIRIKGSDNAWRNCEITARVSSTVVTVRLLDAPLLDTKVIRDWRLGYWSDTTGYPKAGEFFEDRLWLVGPIGNPDMFAGSVTGAYESFSQTDELGVVLDDSAIVARLNSRKLSRALWVSSDDKGLIIGTGSEEYTVRAPNNEVMTARNAKARAASRRGSASVEPVRVDSQVLYVQRGGRTVREFAYVFEADGYKSPSMSQLASHLGAEKFVEMDYAAEPHSIVWIRREDGTLIGLTYNREENVVGWHRHTLGGITLQEGHAMVDALAVMPQKNQLQDALWVVARRWINGRLRRYIERLTPFWDFGFEAAKSQFVDSNLRYEGTPVTVIYGLQHLEGEDVYGLADGLPVGPLTVVDGSVVLQNAASLVTLGLGYESECETARLENGAQDGTAFGKVKRINSLVPMVWDSCFGEVGVWNEEKGGPVYEPIEYPEALDVSDVIVPYTGETKPIVPSPGYDMRATIFFRRTKDKPLPFNILALMPQLNTQDR